MTELRKIVHLQFDVARFCQHHLTQRRNNHLFIIAFEYLDPQLLFHICNRHTERRRTNKAGIGSVLKMQRLSDG